MAKQKYEFSKEPDAHHAPIPWTITAVTDGKELRVLVDYHEPATVIFQADTMHILDKLNDEERVAEIIGSLGAVLDKRKEEVLSHLEAILQKPKAIN